MFLFILCRIYIICGVCVLNRDFLGCGWCKDKCLKREECSLIWYNDSCLLFIYKVEFFKNGMDFCFEIEIVLYVGFL